MFQEELLEENSKQIASILAKPNYVKAAAIPSAAQIRNS